MALRLSVNRQLRLVHLEVLMRSDLVFGAMKEVPNRYLLSQLASKVARKLHRPGTRMQDTTNDVLLRFSGANPIVCEFALRECLVVRSRPIMTRPAIPHKSESVTLAPARENSKPLSEAARVLSA
jgi:hypothetical protein